MGRAARERPTPGEDGSRLPKARPRHHRYQPQSLTVLANAGLVRALGDLDALVLDDRMADGLLREPLDGISDALGDIAFPSSGFRGPADERRFNSAQGVAQTVNGGSSDVDRGRSAPITPGDAVILASEARRRMATFDAGSSPERSTLPMTETVRGPTYSSRR